MKDPNCIQCREWELCPFHAQEEETPEQSREESKCKECKSFPCAGTAARCSLEKYASDRGKTVSQLVSEMPELKPWLGNSFWL